MVRPRIRDLDVPELGRQPARLGAGGPADLALAKRGAWVRGRHHLGGRLDADADDPGARRSGGDYAPGFRSPEATRLIKPATTLRTMPAIPPITRPRMIARTP